MPRSETLNRFRAMEPVVLIQGENGVLRDQEGHICNAKGQKIYREGNPILPDYHVLVGQVAEMQHKIDDIHDILLRERQFRAEADTDKFAEVRYMAGANSYRHTLEHQQRQSSRHALRSGDHNYTSNLASPTQRSKLEMMLEQTIERQQQNSTSFSSKLENLYTNLNEKFESLSIRIKQLDTQMDSHEAPDNILTQDHTQMDHGSCLAVKAVEFVEDRGGFDVELPELESFDAPDSAEIDMDLLTWIVQIEAGPSQEEKFESEMAGMDQETDKPETAVETRVETTASIVASHASNVAPRKEPVSPKSREPAKEGAYRPPLPFPKAPVKSTNVAQCTLVVDKKMVVPREPILASSRPKATHKQKTPNINSLPKVKHKTSKFKPPDSTVLNAGKSVKTPKCQSHPTFFPTFLGRHHAATAYTPPWMIRHSQRHAKSLLKPP